MPTVSGTGSLRLKKPRLALMGILPIVDSTALGSGPRLIQNLGPDALYVQDVTPATTTDGVKVPSGSSIFIGGQAYYAVSDGTSDVRDLGRGLGIY